MLVVTATDLPRFMACNGSRLMEGFVPSITADTTDKDEGIAAHWLVEQVHTGQFTASELIDRKAPNGVYVSAEMVEFTEEYLNDIYGDIEVTTSFHGQTWLVNSRADHTGYRNGILDIYDLKYGWGIVEPEMHWSLIAHAIGWVIANPDKPVHEINFTIYQPRPHHQNGKIRTWTISYVELLELYKVLDNALSNPSDMLYTSPNCNNCPALVNCPAARKAQMNALDSSEKAFTDKLNNATLAYLLDHYKRAIEILTQSHKAYSELALHKVRTGEIVPNYEAESELTNRAWKDFVTPEIAFMLTGLDLTKKQLITPKQAETAGANKDTIANLCERKSKGVKLVRVDPNVKAKKAFGNKN